MSNNRPGSEADLSLSSADRLDHRYPTTLFQITGGGERDRTDDLLLAKQALSQLSYTPLGLRPSLKPGATGAIEDCTASGPQHRTIGRGLNLAWYTHALRGNEVSPVGGPA